MTSRQFAIEEWDRMGIILDPDPLTVDDGPWPLEQLTATRSRDTVLVCLAGMAIIAILAYLLGRAS